MSTVPPDRLTCTYSRPRFTCDHFPQSPTDIHTSSHVDPPCDLYIHVHVDVPGRHPRLYHYPLSRSPVPVDEYVHVDTSVPTVVHHWTDVTNRIPCVPSPYPRTRPPRTLDKRPCVHHRHDTGSRFSGYLRRRSSLTFPVIPLWDPIPIVPSSSSPPNSLPTTSPHHPVRGSLTVPKTRPIGLPR